MAFGVTTEGFVLKRLDDIKTEMEDSLRSSLGPEINLLPQSVLGQIVGIMAERESLVWELMEDVYNSQYPDTAEGVPLDNAAALTGTTRKEATKSTVTGLARGTATTLIPSGSVVSVNGDPTSRFISEADATIAAGFDRIQRISFDDIPDAGAWSLEYNGNVSGSLAYNISATALDAALEAAFGESVKVEGSMADQYFDIIFRSTGAKANITEDSNTLLIGATPIVISIAKQAGVEIALSGESTGPFAAPADSLTVIETPISGWDSFNNGEDADIGRDIETDQELKLRRLEELAIAGRATLEAIRSQLLAINDVTTVVVFQNNNAIEDADGRPPHSVDIVVQGGDEDEIASTIFETIAAGITMVNEDPPNGVTKTIVDSQGFNQTIKFSRPTEVDIYVEVDITDNPATYPSNGDQLVEDAIIAYGETLAVGDDVIVHPAMESYLRDIPGITDVVFRVGIAPAPTSDANISIDPRELAAFDSSRITVTS